MNRAWVVLAVSLMCGTAPVARASASSALVIKPDEKILTEMVAVLRSATQVTVDHVVSRTDPTPFTTRKPSRIHVDLARFSSTLEAPWVDSLAGRLHLDELLSDARAFQGNPCRDDGARRDALTLRFGPKGQGVSAHLYLSRGTCQFMWRDSLRATVGLGPRSTAI